MMGKQLQQKKKIGGGLPPAAAGPHVPNQAEPCMYPAKLARRQARIAQQDAGSLANGGLGPGVPWYGWQPI